MQEDLIVFPMLFSFLAWIVWFVLTTIRRYKVAKLQAEVSNRLIDKFGSSQELLSYVQTGEGKALIGSLTGEPTTPYGRILGALQVGTVLTLLGCALLSLYWTGGARDFLVCGVVILALGIGFAAAAAVSYSFSKSVGLLNGASPRR
jgi:type IV secretory pathway VirB2 component (pilin)